MPSFISQFSHAMNRASEDMDDSLTQAFGSDKRTNAQRRADAKAHEAVARQQAQQAQPVYAQPQPQGQPVYVQAQPLGPQPPQIYVAQPIGARPVVRGLKPSNSTASANARAHAAAAALADRQRADAQARQQPQVVYMQQQPQYVQGQAVRNQMNPQQGQPVFVQQQQLVQPTANQLNPRGISGPHRNKNVFQVLGDDISRAQENFDNSVNRAFGMGPSNATLAADRKAHQLAARAQLNPQVQGQAQVVYVQQGQPMQPQYAQQPQQVYTQGQQGFVQGAPQQYYNNEAPPAYLQHLAPQGGVNAEFSQQQQGQPQQQGYYPVVKPQ